MSKKNGEYVICDTCGKTFYLKLSRVLKSEKHYCSRKCRNTSKIVSCAWCGKEIRRIACRTKEHNYCNSSHQLKYEYGCGIRKRKPSEKLYKAHKEKCSGANNYMWKGGTTDEIALRMNNIEWHKIRKRIYERDNWTCQICGVHGGKKNKLHCHHIVPYRVSQDNSEENLISLCAKCHRIEEIKYHRSLK